VLERADWNEISVASISAATLAGAGGTIRARCETGGRIIHTNALAQIHKEDTTDNCE
jgi:hypothetical protein